MEIHRYGIVQRPNSLPHISGAVLHGDTAAWNEWVDRDNPPVRACVRADLVAPGLLVEIMVTAGR